MRLIILALIPFCLGGVFANGINLFWAWRENRLADAHEWARRRVIGGRYWR